MWSRGAVFRGDGVRCGAGVRFSADKMCGVEMQLGTHLLPLRRHP